MKVPQQGNTVYRSKNHKRLASLGLVPSRGGDFGPYDFTDEDRAELERRRDYSHGGQLVGVLHELARALAAERERADRAERAERQREQREYENRNPRGPF
jgi:hypothetical protein